jgi:TPR repeat protein
MTSNLPIKLTAKIRLNKRILVRQIAVLVIAAQHPLFSMAQNCPYDPQCINNPYGAGSSYKSDGLMNPYSIYGSKNSNQSWTNPYATDAPKLYDKDGNYRGRLSSNRNDLDSTSNPNGRYGNKYSPESINNPYGAGNPYSNKVYVQPQGSAIQTAVVPSNRMPESDDSLPYISPKAAGGAVVALIGVALVAIAIKAIWEGFKSSNFTSANAPQPATVSVETKRQWGEYYLLGPQEKRDYPKALDFLTEAARADDPKAQFALGTMYANGHGGTKNLEQAYEFYLKAANQGHLAAQAVIGDYYTTGTGTEKNYFQAFHYYKLAADAGNPQAQTQVGAFLAYGMGVEKNLAEAKTWLQKADAAGNVWGKYYLGILLMNDPKSTSTEKAYVVPFFETARKAKIVHATYMLGQLYETGTEVPTDEKLAFSYYTEGAALNEKNSVFRLAYFYETGKAVEKDAREAIRLYQKADELGLPGAKMKVKMLERML